MIKIITVFLIFIFSFTGVFAYSPSTKDYKLLNTIYKKIDLICNDSEDKCKVLEKRIENFSYEYRKIEKIFFILNKLSIYIKKKLIRNNYLDINTLL
jgi:hypothetical protein